MGDLLVDASAVRAAVAFVTQGGVEVLADLLDKRPPIERFEIVARGAPITEPDALVHLRDELGIDVSVIAEGEAARFHPKLWLIEAGDEVRVLSGSGNLTAGGMDGNREQFEVVRCVGDERAEQMERFARLTAGAIHLDSFVGSIAWRTWQQQQERRRNLAEILRGLDKELAAGRADNREADKLALTEDLWDLYRLIADEKLVTPQGKPYIPHGLRLALEGHRGSNEPVKIAANLCKQGTEGFDELRGHDRLDLTVEYLIADEDKQYHTLFPPAIRATAAARLHEAEEKGSTPPAEARRRPPR